MVKKIIFAALSLCVMGAAQAAPIKRSAVKEPNAQAAATEKLQKAVLGKIKNPCLAAAAALQAGANVHVSMDGEYSTPLHYACSVANLPMVDVLCKIGEANIDACDGDGVTPLMDALLAHGDDEDMPKTSRQTEVRLAIAQYLLDRGASLTVPDDLGWSVIMYLHKALHRWEYQGLVQNFITQNRIVFTPKNLTPVQFED